MKVVHVRAVRGQALPLLLNNLFRCVFDKTAVAQLALRLAQVDLFALELPTQACQLFLDVNQALERQEYLQI